jgi:anti-sigma factor ChrR (cupin superfamily)
MAEPFALLDIVGGGWRELAFTPFRDGIEVCHLIEGEPGVAVLRYAPGATVPRHRHTGLETVLVLEGSQRDERGVYGPGAVVFNTAGSVHDVVSDDGCVVLIQWHRPIQFLDDEV